jgi:hypothetical protein
MQRAKHRKKMYTRKVPILSVDSVQGQGGICVNHEKARAADQFAVSSGFLGQRGLGS